jgi:hypothetical protein
LTVSLWRWPSPWCCCCPYSAFGGLFSKITRFQSDFNIL